MRNIMIDALKGLGIISVIFSHVYRGDTDSLAIFIRELTMWSVPMFFMVQGYFMPKCAGKPWLQSSWHKITKTYFPYLYWAIIYGFFYYFTAAKSFTVGDLILGNTALHLYYMFYYIIFALFMPLLYFIPKNWRRYALYVMVLSNIYWQFMLEFTKTNHIHWLSYSGPVPIKWWGFVAMGMLLGEYPQIRKFICTHARVFFYGALSMAAIGLVEPYLTHTLGYYYNKIAIFPLSGGITLALAIYYSSEKAMGKRILAYVGKRTLGIYLAHFILVDFLRDTVFQQDRTLVVIVILLICLAMKDCKDYLEQHRTLPPHPLDSTA